MADSTSVRIRDLHDRRNDEDYSDMTAAQRLEIMWQLALDAYAFQGAEDAESRLSRDTVHILRRES
jgi:hypothetical protein